MNAPGTDGAVPPTVKLNQVPLSAIGGGMAPVVARTCQ